MLFIQERIMRRFTAFVTRVWVLLCILIFSAASLVAQPLTAGPMEYWVPVPPAFGVAALYVSTGDQSAKVAVNAVASGAGTPRSYDMQAHTSIAYAVPETIRLDDGEGTYSRAVHVTSDAPVSAYAHLYTQQRAAGNRLLPVEAWGTSYVAADIPFNSNAYVSVIAAYDGTMVEVVPAANTDGGHAANVPYKVSLNKGQVYKLKMTTDATGTMIRSLPDASGVCKPVGVFTGSYSMYIHTRADMPEGSREPEFTQIPPIAAWGKHFLTAPFSTTETDRADRFNTSLIRVVVNDPATVVKRNGVVLTGIKNNRYYDFLSAEANNIESDQPVMTVQYMVSKTDKDVNVRGMGDGEMIVVSPLEAAARQANFTHSYRAEIVYNFLTIIIPTNGVGSLTIDGDRTFTHSYAHPNIPGYSVVIKRWVASGEHCTVKSDSAFTAIAYGVYDVESYAFDVTPVDVPKWGIFLQEENDVTSKKEVCSKMPFRFVFKTEYEADQLEWKIENIPGLTPSGATIIQVKPVADSSGVQDGRMYRVYSVPALYRMNLPDTISITVTVISPVIDGCAHSKTYTGKLVAKALPIADFSYKTTACVPFETDFTAGATTDTSTLVAWRWRIEAAAFNTVAVHYSFGESGKKGIYLHVTAANGCTDEATKDISLTNGITPTARFQVPGRICMPYGAAKFVNQSVYTGIATPVRYTWELGDATTSAATDPVHYYAAKGSYPVKLIATAGDGCADTTDTQLVSSFVDRPKAAFEMSATASCTGDNITFTDKSVPAAGSSIVGWNWDLGNGHFEVTEQHPFKVFTSAGDVGILHYVTSIEGCVSDTANDRLRVYSIPVAEAGPDKVLFQGGSVQLEGSVTATGDRVIQWTPAQYVSATDVLMPFVHPPADQLFYLRVSSGPCSNYDSVMVEVLLNIQVPSAFTPNNDGNHDRWEIPGLNTYRTATVQVFNRYGQKVFESKGYATSWDGNFQGKPLAAGTYYYVIHPGEGKQAQAGPVTILR